MITSASDPSALAFGSPPRPLTEKVVQSAEEALVSNPASVETLQGGEPVPVKEVAEQARPGYADRLARRVGQKPLQSALLALAAGAFLTVMARSALRRRH